MTRIRQVILWCWIVAVGFMGFVPPWSEVLPVPGGSSPGQDLGYAVVFAPPDRGGRGVGVDISRLCVQVGTVSLVAGGLLLALRRVP